MSFQVLISLSSFGAAEVGRHGQLWCSQLALEAGADSVEVRGEMLRNPEAELPSLAGLASVYSSPEGLWAEGGWLDSAALARGIAAATRLGAKRLKMSIGDFRASSHGSLWGLKVQLAETRVELLIENDQTVRAGTLPALQTFFDVADQRRRRAWHDLRHGQLALAGRMPAAGRRRRWRIACATCIARARSACAHKWVAVPLGDSAAPWRAVLRALPADVPHAIEYPLVGDDLMAVARTQIDFIRSARA